MTENFSEIINEETAPQKLLNGLVNTKELAVTSHLPLSIHTAVNRTSATARR